MGDEITIFLIFLNEKIGLFSIIFNTMGIILLALIVSVIGLILFRKILFFKRSIAFLNVCKYSYIIVIPMSIIFITSSYYMINFIKEKISAETQNLEESLTYLINYTEKQTTKDLTITININKSMDENVDNIVALIRPIFLKVNLEKHQALSDKVVVYLISSEPLLKYYLKKQLVEIINKKLIPAELSSDILQLTPKQLFSPHVVINIILNEINKFLNLFLIKIILINFVILLAIGVEIFYSKRKLKLDK